LEYLGIELKKPKVAFFDFTCCEGCQLQIANKEDTLIDLLSLVEVVNFREISSEKGDDYQIAFIEGAISRQDEVDRVKEIREKTGTLVALGTCACYGGVNSLKNKFPLEDTVKEVYGDDPKETLPVKSVKEVVHVDFEIPGCPISNAVCINGKLPCYGCRGPAAEQNWPSLKSILLENGFSLEQIEEKTSFFNSLSEVTKQ